MEHSDFLSDQTLKQSCGSQWSQQMFCKVALPLPGIPQGSRERAEVLNLGLKAPWEFFTDKRPCWRKEDDLCQREERERLMPVVFKG